MYTGVPGNGEGTSKIDSDTTSLSEAPSQSPNFELSLVNYFNAQYIGHLYIGGSAQDSTSDMQYMTMIYDTGSHWTWVQLDECQEVQGSSDKLCTKEMSGYDPSSSAYIHHQKNYGMN